MDTISNELFKKKIAGKKYLFLIGRFYCLSPNYAQSMVSKFDLMYETVYFGIYEEPCLCRGIFSDDVLYLTYENGGEIPIDIVGSTKIYQDGRTYGIWNKTSLYILLEV